ncbi:sulfurtransferase-like selenium metabolism protein YedF [Clostridium fermenticellae]|uniref:Sulfurtransferase-like selenium metabolism protein YedF n=1 Tax=Clostridium fermenticellae TaxID=2068654 RepID=A0A386H3K6_9CLOT|nr:sulfurtransferase-like selenium metabolism protein YedF [Clostridium fermenticellae]AYD40311.1 sulfurtransferase-like selenium metabolism protein YedF [Clostridium fermenticellae]
MEKIIDCSGLKCPEPVIRTKHFFDSIEQGEATIIVDNDVAKNNISKFSKNNGFKYSISSKNNMFYIKIIKDNCQCDSIKTNEKPLIVISSDKLGNGNDELGITLMKSYLYALSENDTLPSDLIFLNGGVKLTSHGSECLKSILSLKDKGVNILSCGTCLDFYNLKDKLAVGEITNMYTIAEKMNSASNTIKL